MNVHCYRMFSSICILGAGCGSLCKVPSRASCACRDFHLQAVVSLAPNTSPKRQKLTTSAAVFVEGGAEAATKSCQLEHWTASESGAAGTVVPDIVIPKLANQKPGPSLGLSVVERASVNLDRAQNNSNQKATRAAASRAGSGGCKSAGSAHSTGGKAAASGGGKRSRGSSPVTKPAGGSNRQQDSVGTRRQQQHQCQLQQQAAPVQPGAWRLP